MRKALLDACLIGLPIIIILLYGPRRLWARLRRAFWIAFAAFLALFLVRLILFPPSWDDWPYLALAGGLGLVWLALWGLNTAAGRRRGRSWP